MKNQKVCLENWTGWSMAANKRINHKKLAPAVREPYVTKD